MSDVPDYPEIKRPRLLPSMAAYGPPPSTADPIPCPRCNSTETKFCYYNNYNLSQPRHFCKGCRRYWTRGGTLRNVPVGGGTRKRPKRSRLCSTSSNSSGSPSSSSLTHENRPTSESDVEKPDFPFDRQQQEQQKVLNLNDNARSEGGFMSLMNSQGQPGFLSLGGYGNGSGFVNGFQQGYGYGARAGGADFPMEMASCFGSLYGVHVAASPSGFNVNTWQMGGC